MSDFCQTSKTGEHCDCAAGCCYCGRVQANGEWVYPEDVKGSLEDETLCRYCGKPIALTLGDVWVHTDSWHDACERNEDGTGGDYSAAPVFSRMQELMSAPSILENEFAGPREHHQLRAEFDAACEEISRLRDRVRSLETAVTVIVDMLLDENLGRKLAAIAEWRHRQQQSRS